MKYTGKYIAAGLLVLSLSAFKKDELGSWKEKQLADPVALAGRIAKGDTSNLLILNTGPVEDIQGAVNIGAVEDAKNLAKLKDYLQPVARDKEVILYCGCCPLSVCPNLHPAYDMLRAMHFTNYKVLRLTHDLQEDWIDKGYPVAN
ncbi:rhodanese-like domain-containing protein [Taibaiella koreensis]|uniref:rhodanese-like domain-containing protein n=1 Tax=Taibaiella koreensis TaxID=1268548 RepID=UPI0013C34E49|nr:rhodanese-like domain-containing protein [Taibaiella koreensis]